MESSPPPPSPSPFPFGMPTPPVSTVPHCSGGRIRKQDWRNGSTPVRLFIAAFCQPAVVSVTYIFLHSLLSHMVSRCG